MPGSWPAVRARSLFELRAALDVARFDASPNRRGACASVVARFPAGVGYPELNEAEAMLAERSAAA